MVARVGGNSLAVMGVPSGRLLPSVAVLTLSGAVDITSVDGVSILFGWGIAICVVSFVQLAFALRLDFPTTAGRRSR